MVRDFGDQLLDLRRDALAIEPVGERSDDADRVFDVTIPGGQDRQHHEILRSHDPHALAA